MNTHIKIISVIDIVLGGLTVLAGVALFLAFVTGAVAVEQAAAATAGAILAAGIFSSLFVIAVGILGIVVGIKLTEHENWARITQIIFGIIQLVNFPLGTAFGIYSLWAMFTEDGRALFERQPEERVRRVA